MGTTSEPATHVEPPTGVLARLASLLPSLRESERKIAEYVLANAAEVVFLSITELADRTGTSEATVIRFARQLDYSGYAAFKIALALDRRAAATSLPTELTATGDVAGIKQRVLQLSIESLRDTAQLLDDSALERAVDALVAARRIEIYGVGGSAVVAQHAYMAFMQIGLPAYAVIDPHLQVASATQLGPRDVALAISQSGSSRDTVEALQHARQAGATCLCITRYARSPITRVAHVTLLAAARPTTIGGLPAFADVAQFAIIDVLAASAAARRATSAAVLARGRQALSAKRF
jgi:DNA-binding MurR/RpiR family transcriptional regulator